MTRGGWGTLQLGKKTAASLAVLRLSPPGGGGRARGQGPGGAFQREAPVTLGKCLQTTPRVGGPLPLDVFEASLAGSQFYAVFFDRDQNINLLYTWQKKTELLNRFCFPFLFFVPKFFFFAFPSLFWSLNKKILRAELYGQKERNVMVATWLGLRQASSAAAGFIN